MLAGLDVAEGCAQQQTEGHQHRRRSRKGGFHVDVSFSKQRGKFAALLLAVYSCQREAEQFVTEKVEIAGNG